VSLALDVVLVRNNPVCLPLWCQDAVEAQALISVGQNLASTSRCSTHKCRSCIVCNDIFEKTIMYDGMERPVQKRKLD